MLTTQQFADLCDTTKKTIIHYDKIGLLKPRTYHRRNRLYQPKQVLVFQKIYLLKSFGMTLSEIKKYLNRDKLLLDLFGEKQKYMEMQKSTLEKKINKIREFTDNLQKHKTLVVPKIKTVKPYIIYAMNKTGRYIDIKKHQEELFKLIGDTEYENAGLTIFFDEGYSPDNARMITGILIKDHKPKEIKGVQIIRFPSYKAVCYVHYGTYSYMSYIWQFLNRFIEDNNLKIHPDLPCREFYLLGELRESDENKWITELQIPIA